MGVGRKKGTPKTGGRKRGSVNKATKDVRAAIAKLAEDLGPSVIKWLRRGSKKDPVGAARVYGSLIEYHIPKLSRTEVVGPGGGPLQAAMANYKADDAAAARTYFEMLGK